MNEHFDESNSGSTDWIATELIREVKEENQRKTNLIRLLIKVIIAIVAVGIIGIAATNAAWLLYINQYDFYSTESYYTEQTAEGVYAIIDSNGNVISSDLTEEEAARILEVLTNGESYGEENSN